MALISPVALLLPAGPGGLGKKLSTLARLAQAFGTGGAAPGQPPPPGPSSTLQRDLQEAQADYAQAQAALRNGDLGTYAADVAKMNTALNAALKAAGTSAPAGRHPSPSAPPASPPAPSASPSARPSP